MRTIVIVAALSWVALAVGCDDENEDGLAVGTYNAGLAPGFVPFTEERAPLTIQAIAEQPLDVLCVQEMWTAESVTALRTASASRWPNTFFPAADPGDVVSTTPACEAAALTPLATCVSTSCAGLPTDQLTGCVLGGCQPEINALDAACSTCLAANIGASFDAIAGTCTTMPSSPYAFGGSFGVGLLSRQPLLEPDFLVLDSTFNRRGVIYARVDTDRVGEVHVFCTHLTAIFADIPFPTAGGSWEAEQRAQIEEMLAFIDEKTDDDDRVIILGDLNTGPAFGDVEAEEAANYALFTNAGFENPFIDDVDVAACTFCADNPLVSDTSASVTIDHMLVRGLDADGTARRFLTQPVEIDVDGEPTTVALSDHWGVRATLFE